MKAAVMYKNGAGPKIVEIDQPVAEHAGERTLKIETVAIKHVDRSRASGTHYSASPENNHGKVIGSDGIGTLENGQRVYAVSQNGMLAEFAVVNQQRTVPVPVALDSITAAALPNGVIGSAMALLFRAKLKKGENVLINGATGFTGRLALQLAKHYGAGKVIATGRNPEALKALIDLGADEVLSLSQDDDAVTAQLRELNSTYAFDVIIDYLWGRSAELLLDALKGKGDFTRALRFVSVGGVTGDTIRLSSEVLRSVNLQISGSGLGSLTREDIGSLFTDVLPEAFQLAAEGRLKIETLEIPMNEIESVFNLKIPGNKRLVVRI